MLTIIFVHWGWTVSLRLKRVQRELHLIKTTGSDKSMAMVCGTRVLSFSQFVSLATVISW